MDRNKINSINFHNLPHFIKCRWVQTPTFRSRSKTSPKKKWSWSSASAQIHFTRSYEVSWTCTARGWCGEDLNESLLLLPSCIGLSLRTGLEMGCWSSIVTYSNWEWGICRVSFLAALTEESYIPQNVSVYGNPPRAVRLMPGTPSALPPYSWHTVNATTHLGDWCTISTHSDTLQLSELQTYSLLRDVSLYLQLSSWLQGRAAGHYPTHQHFREHLLYAFCWEVGAPGFSPFLSLSWELGNFMVSSVP